MPDKLFLETYPLYRKLNLSFGGIIGGQSAPPINVYCMRCESIQTFHGGWNTRTAELAAAGTVAHLAYVCSACKRYTHNFLIHFAETYDSVTKVGQFPPWDIVPDPALDRLAGDYAPILRRGLICESQGYGIGAFAYYRRIVEHVIGTLLDDIGALIPPEEAATYGRALAAAKDTIAAKDKIFLVKDLRESSLVNWTWRRGKVSYVLEVANER